MLDDRDEKSATGRLTDRPAAEDLGVRENTRDGFNSTVAGAAGKPSPHLFDPAIEELLENNPIPVEETDFQCPRCVEEANRIFRKLSEGAALDDESRHSLIRDLTPEPTLRVRRYWIADDGELALYHCRRCGWSGAHYRRLKGQYEAAEVRA